MPARLHRGFTLIELLVAMAIGILLLVLAMPSYTQWIADNEIRNGAESVASGLRYAQATAVSRNLNAQFVLNATGWNVSMVDDPLVSLQTASFNEGSSNATIIALDTTALVAATTVAFNPLGQVIVNAGNLARVDVSMPSMAASRPLRVVVGDGRTGVKLCNPNAPATDPQGCP